MDNLDCSSSFKIGLLKRKNQRTLTKQFIDKVFSKNADADMLSKR